MRKFNREFYHQSVHKDNNARCEICNQIGSSELSIHDEDMGSGLVYKTATGYTCSDCHNAYRGIMMDWDIIDEIEEEDEAFEYESE